jgi:hypothetical protein
LYFSQHLSRLKEWLLDYLLRYPGSLVHGREWGDDLVWMWRTLLVLVLLLLLLLIQHRLTFWVLIEFLLA